MPDLALSAFKPLQLAGPPRDDENGHTPVFFQLPDVFSTSTSAALRAGGAVEAGWGGRLNTEFTAFHTAYQPYRSAHASAPAGLPQ